MIKRNVKKLHESKIKYTDLFAGGCSNCLQDEEQRVLCTWSVTYPFQRVHHFHALHAFPHQGKWKDEER
jgi:hypothetical protein